MDDDDDDDYDDDDVLTLLGHVRQILPVAIKQATKSVSMEENKIIRVRQDQYARERC